ncbi:Alpha/beta hydrolase fold-1 [Suillus clintonianus]|uniref:Alpha/beta hydrolase fold-1 n=1 Tax=Suillus clintonianus TaxID=1904413 RepID=UPI001B866C67|nr:Alpha/beta hydrolase fold-1 [Suillus clintonianus]KAG2126065.1 Alpha/beta hydrolase fold-1 [Suillus clintonianus]
MSQLPLPERRVLSLHTTLGSDPVELKCSTLYYPVSCAKDGLTLVFTHGIASHKEQYDPTIVRLLSHAQTRAIIRDIWVLDFPNHGQTALLNRPVLDARKAAGKAMCTTADIALYLQAFLSTPSLKSSTVVGVAHSGSCTLWVFALTSMPPSLTPFALIMVEPTLMFPSLTPTDPRAIHGAANVRGCLAKRDRWTEREALTRWLVGGKGVWRKWDERVLSGYVKYGFEEVIESELDAGKRKSHVTPTLRKDEESPLYACLSHTVEPESLGRACRAVEEAGRGVHVVWAEFEEFISKTARKEILDAAEHRVVSQRTIKGAGHLVPQEKPDALGEALVEILDEIVHGSGDTKAKM